MRLPSFMLLGSLVVAVTIGACSSSPADDGASDYLEEVAASQQLTSARFAEFGELFGQSWPLRERLVSSLIEAGVGTAFDGQLEALEALQAPEQYADGHRILVDGFRGLVSVDKRAAAAVEADDMVAFAIFNGQLSARSTRLLADLPKDICHALTEAEERFSSEICERADWPDGTYQREITDAVWSLVLESRSIAGALGSPLSLTEAEQEVLLRSQIPQAAALLRTSIDQVAKMDASVPAEFAEDHESFKDVLSASLGFFETISEQLDSGEIQRAAASLVGFESFTCELEPSFETADFASLVDPVFENCR